MIQRFFGPLNFHIVKITQSSLLLRKNKRYVYTQHVAKIPTVFHRCLCDNPKMTNHDVDFEQVKNATNNNNIYIIDVREPEEIKELGKIPNSINIPLGKVYTALSAMNDKDFKITYNRERPSEDCEIIFYCAIGRRSGMAQKTAYDLGYKNVKNYLGSYTDWAKKSN